jgi:hypothetical protein
MGSIQWRSSNFAEEHLDRLAFATRACNSIPTRQTDKGIELLEHVVAAEGA